MDTILKSLPLSRSEFKPFLLSQLPLRFHTIHFCSAQTLLLLMRTLHFLHPCHSCHSRLQFVFLNLERPLMASQGYFQDIQHFMWASYGSLEKKKIKEVRNASLMNISPFPQEQHWVFQRRLPTMLGAQQKIPACWQMQCSFMGFSQFSSNTCLSPFCKSLDHVMGAAEKLLFLCHWPCSNIVCAALPQTAMLFFLFLITRLKQKLVVAWQGS